MSKNFYLNDRDGAIHADHLLIKSDDYQKLVRAAEIIEQAHVLAQKILQEAKAEYIRQKDKGYTEGMEQGLAEISVKIAESAIAASRYIAGLEQRIVDLVMSALKKILGSMNADKLVCRLARKAIACVRGQKEITVSVHPERVAAVKAELERLIQKMPRTDLLEVRPEPRLAADACIIESEIGYVNGSLDVQLEAIKNAFESELGKRQR